MSKGERRWQIKVLLEHKKQQLVQSQQSSGTTGITTTGPKPYYWENRLAPSLQIIVHLRGYLSTASTKTPN